MPEFSILWETITGTGDGISSYDMAESNQMLTGYEFDTLAKNQGVLADTTGRLAVSGTISPLTIQDGRAIVHHFRYINTGAITLPVPTPSNDTAHRVVLEANWSTNKVRILLSSSGDGDTTPPELTRTYNAIWQIPLAKFVIDSNGNIWTDSNKNEAGVYDDRHFIISKMAGMVPVLDEILDGTKSEVSFRTQGEVSEVMVLASLRVDKANASESNVGIRIGDESGTYTYLQQIFKGDGTSDAANDGSFLSSQSTARFIPMPAADAPSGYYGVLLVRIIAPGQGVIMPVFVMGSSVYGASANECKLMEGFVALSSNDEIDDISIYSDAPFALGSRISAFVLR